MKSLKKILVILLFLFILPYGVNAEEAATTEIKVYMFRGEGCGFCEKALTFFESIENDYGKYFELVTYEVWNDVDNQKLMQDVGEYLNKNITGVPLIIIGEKTYSGFDESYGDSIKADIVAEYNKAETDRVDVIVKAQEKKDEGLDTDIVVAIISAVVVIGIGIFIYTARKGIETDVVEEPKIVEEKVVEEVEVVEVKKMEKEKKPVKEEKPTSKKVTKKTSDTKEKKKNNTTSKNKSKK